jgi:glucose-6-phosphate 1-dehydrogenase
MHSLVIFGASGDLTSRKLIPALYNLFLKKRLPQPINIVGCARTPMNDDGWRGKLAETTKTFAGKVFSEDSWNAFVSSIHYHAGDISSPQSFASLGSCLDSLEKTGGSGAEAERVYYLATAPEFYGPAAEQLGAAGLAVEKPGASRRIVVEKPFGIDLDSAEKLSDVIHKNFNESQVYRIDHYLGK